MTRDHLAIGDNPEARTTSGAFVEIRTSAPKGAPVAAFVQATT
jgi:hypothetical protein